MIIFLLVTFFLVILFLVIYFILSKKEQSFGILAKERLYSDSQTFPGETLFSNSIPLVGRPDFIVKDQDLVIPVEKKTCKTPVEPYQNHVMQLMAYCLLIEENFGVRPPGGYLKYPEKEFKIAYTDKADESVRRLVKEILDNKKSNQEFYCQHKEHHIYD